MDNYVCPFCASTNWYFVYYASNKQCIICERCGTVIVELLDNMGEGEV